MNSIKKLIVLLFCIEYLNGMLTTNSIFSSSAISASLGKTHFILNYPYNTKNNNHKILKSHYSTQTQAPKKQRISKKKLISLLDQNRESQAFFTSNNGVRSIIAELIENAQETIFIAAYTLTDQKIVDLLKEAHERGLEIEIVTDFGNINQNFSKITTLAEIIPIFYYSPKLSSNAKQKNCRTSLMHHKFIIVDGKIVVNGSANLTVAGQEGNIEHITVLKNSITVQEFMNEFECLKKQSLPYKN